MSATASPIGRIQRVPLRDVWAHEAHDLTRWLRDNIDVLSDILEREIVSVECEQPVGAFSADLIAEDEHGNTVVIENQLERSDHDHLGKLLTYLVGVDAKVAVWITPQPRPEHVGVVSWLNKSSPVDVYLVKLETISIGESAPAPLLTLIDGPSEETRAARETKKEISHRHVERRRFWEAFLDNPRVADSSLGQCAATERYWLSRSTGQPGVSLNAVVLQHTCRLELYIDRGTARRDEARAMFFELIRAKPEIEAAFGGPLKWDELEGRNGCSIAQEQQLGGWKDEDRWPAVHEALIDAYERLERAIMEHVAALR